MSNPTPNARDYAMACELIDAIRKGLSASELKAFITIQHWTMANAPNTTTDDAPREGADPNRQEGNSEA
jgi:hypothetical protein